MESKQEYSNKFTFNTELCAAMLNVEQWLIGPRYASRSKKGCDYFIGITKRHHILSHIQYVSHVSPTIPRFTRLNMQYSILKIQNMFPERTWPSHQSYLYLLKVNIHSLANMTMEQMSSSRNLRRMKWIFKEWYMKRTQKLSWKTWAFWRIHLHHWIMRSMQCWMLNAEPKVIGPRYCRIPPPKKGCLWISLNRH